MKKINILHISEFPPPIGGLQKCAEDIYNNSHLNNKYVFYKIDNSKIIKSKNIVKILLFLISIFRLIRITSTKKINICHIHFSTKFSVIRSVIYALILKYIFDTKIIMHAHGGRFPEFFNNSNIVIKKLIIHVFSIIDTLIVLSEKWKLYYANIASCEILVLPNAVNLKEYKYKYNGLKIVFVGLVSQKKGLFDLLKVVSKNKGIILDIIGPEEDQGQLNKWLNELNLSQNEVKYHGTIYDEDLKFSILSNASLFVLPSYAEAMPIVLLEAMSVGLPCVATNVGAIPEIIKHKNNGLIIEAGDIISLENAITGLLNDEKLLYEFSKESFQLINLKYNFESYVSNLNLIYYGLSK